MPSDSGWELSDLISIVIVHWNTAELLSSCLDSISTFASSPSPEVIIVDCASTDNTHRAVTSRRPETTLVQMDCNRGYAAGCNAGYQHTTSEVVLFLNADTEILDGALDGLESMFNLNPRVGLVAPLVLNPDQSIQSSGYNFPGVANLACDLLPVPDRIWESSFNGRKNPGNRFHPYVIDYPLGAAIAVRRSALDDIGGWDEEYGMYCEEIDVARRLAERGWSRILNPRSRVIHHGGASTQQRSTAMQHALWKSRGRYHRLWSSRSQQRLLTSFVNVATRIRRDRRTGKKIRDAFNAGYRR